MKAKNSRRIAFDVLLAIERGAYANLALREALQENGGADAAFVTALVYNTLDHLLTLDFYLKCFCKGRIALPVRCILRLGMAQMFYMRVPARAAIDESVALCKEIGKGGVAGFVNGVLRNMDRNRQNLPEPQGGLAERLSIQYSFPAFLVEMLLSQWGEKECIAMLDYTAPAAVCIRANPLCFSESALDEYLAKENMAFQKGRLVPEARYVQGLGDIAQHPLFQQGKITVQSESAMLAARICGAEAGQKVLDACAAPGGKTAFLAGEMGDGQLDAWDVHAHRVTLIEKTCRRMGIHFVCARQQDATQLDPNAVEQYDVVLADVPCSGLGVIGSKPDIRYSKTREDMEALVNVQRRILENMASYVKIGGTLVYVTCTVMEPENQGNIDWFLTAHSEFETVSLDAFLPGDFDQARIGEGGLQLMPHRDHGADGFYMVRMVRKH